MWRNSAYQRLLSASTHWIPICPRNSEFGSPIHTTRQNALLRLRSTAITSPGCFTPRRRLTRAPRSEMSYVHATSRKALFSPSQQVTRMGKATWMRLDERSGTGLADSCINRKTPEIGSPYLLFERCSIYGGNGPSRLPLGHEYGYQESRFPQLALGAGIGEDAVVRSYGAKKPVR